MDLIADDVIYESSYHCGFTALTLYEDTLLYAFREATVHNPKTSDDYGVLKIFKIVDGEIVDTTILAVDSVDLRDPYFFRFKDQLWIYSLYTQRKNAPHKSYSGIMYSYYDGTSWSEFNNIVTDTYQPEITWKVREHKDTLYSISYNMRECSGGPRLMRSIDGINWITKKKLNYPHIITETDIAFKSDSIFFCMRNEEYIGANSIWGYAKDDFREFDSLYMDYSIASPEIRYLSNGVFLLSGREYAFNNPKPDSINVTLLKIDSKGKCLDKLTLKNNRLGDKGYPSFVIRHDTLFMSYYFYYKEKSELHLVKIALNHER